MYSRARRGAEIIPFPSNKKTNKMLASDARPRGRKRAGEPSAEFLFLRRKKLARRIFLFLFSFLRRMDGKISKSGVKFLKK